MKLSRKDKMDIYSLARTSEFAKSPSRQRCIFGDYRRNGVKEEEVRTYKGWIGGANYRERLLCQPMLYRAYIMLQQWKRYYFGLLVAKSIFFFKKGFFKN